MPPILRLLEVGKSWPAGFGNAAAAPIADAASEVVKLHAHGAFPFDGRLVGLARPDRLAPRNVGEAASIQPGGDADLT